MTLNYEKIASNLLKNTQSHKKFDEKDVVFRLVAVSLDKKSSKNDIFFVLNVKNGVFIVLNFLKMSKTDQNVILIGLNGGFDFKDDAFLNFLKRNSVKKCIEQHNINKIVGMALFDVGKIKST